MTVERSGHGELTTKADDVLYQDTSWAVFHISTPQQWQQIDNNVICYNLVTNYATSPSRISQMVFNGCTALNYDLEYALKVYSVEGNNVGLWVETDYKDNGTIFDIATQEWNENRRFTIEIYVQRKDGNQLSRQDMKPSVFQIMRRQSVTLTTALPQDWLTGTAGTYTTDFSTMTTVVPTVCDIDDNEFNAFIDIPNKIVAGINLCILGVGSLLNLKYVTFLICFVLIVGLIAWLIH